MKNSNQKLALLTGLATALFSTQAAAELSANAGFVSEYYYRGILQNDASASAGIDYETDGFYVGAWAADVGDGLEVDGYLGYGIETESGITASIGATGYYYTGEFDDTYEEINLSLGYGMVSVDYSVGTWGGFGAEADYNYLSLNIEHKGFYGTYGTFGDEFDGDFIEIGYHADVAGFDLGVAGIFSSDELSDQVDSKGQPTESEALIFSISRSFSLK